MIFYYYWCSWFDKPLQSKPRKRLAVTTVTGAAAAPATPTCTNSWSIFICSEPRGCALNSVKRRSYGYSTRPSQWQKRSGSESMLVKLRVICSILRIERVLRGKGTKKSRRKRYRETWQEGLVCEWGWAIIFLTPTLSFTITFIFRWPISTLRKHLVRVQTPATTAWAHCWDRPSAVTKVTNSSWSYTIWFLSLKNMQCSELAQDWWSRITVAWTFMRIFPVRTIISEWLTEHLISLWSPIETVKFIV